MERPEREFWRGRCRSVSPWVWRALLLALFCLGCGRRAEPETNRLKVPDEVRELIERPEVRPEGLIDRRDMQDQAPTEVAREGEAEVTEARVVERAADGEHLPDGDGSGGPSGADPARVVARQDIKVSDRGCALLTEEAVPLWPRPGPVAVVADGDEFFVAGYAKNATEGEDVFVVRVDHAAVVPIRHRRLTNTLKVPRIAPPALTVSGQHVAVAAVDGKSHVLFGATRKSGSSGPFPLDRVADKADPRMSPALVPMKAGKARFAVAYTHGDDKGMKVDLLTLDGRGREVKRFGVTPHAGAASAPMFAAGADEPTLFLMDARAGISPILRLRVSKEGEPTVTEVLRAVGTAATPPQIAPVVVGTDTFVAYTVVGNLARTAVGLINVSNEASTPAALVPGQGYGLLHVSVAAGPAAAIFASTVPKAEERKSPRRLQLRVVDDEGMGEPLFIEGPSGTAHFPAVARSRDGRLLLAFAAPGGVYGHIARCDDE